MWLRKWLLEMNGSGSRFPFDNVNIYIDLQPVGKDAILSPISITKSKRCLTQNISRVWENTTTTRGIDELMGIGIMFWHCSAAKKSFGIIWDFLQFLVNIFISGFFPLDFHLGKNPKFPWKSPNRCLMFAFSKSNYSWWSFSGQIFNIFLVNLKQNWCFFVSCPLGNMVTICPDSSVVTKRN